MFLCVSYEKCSEVVKGYIHHYNSNAVQTCLGGLTPENFYKYAVTGIYPFSDYFGVKPDITKTEDILKKQLQQRLEQQAKKALKKRQNHKNNQECGGGSGTVAEAPLERVDKDLALLERQLKWQMSIIHGSAKVNEYLEEHSLAAEAYLPFLNGLIQEARQAREYMVHLSETELEQLSKPGSWKGVPWLEYAEKMRMLFDYKPLHIFREDFQRLLRRVDFITINRKVYRWRNCPAGKEILAAAA